VWLEGPDDVLMATCRSCRACAEPSPCLVAALVHAGRLSRRPLRMVSMNDEQRCRPQGAGLADRGIQLRMLP
jgi:hypothetical protein